MAFENARHGPLYWFILSVARFLDGQVKRYTCRSASFFLKHFFFLLYSNDPIEADRIHLLR